MKLMKWWAKRIVFFVVLASLGVFSGVGCTFQPSLRVTEERLAELEENIGVQLLKYSLELETRDFEMLTPYIRTNLAEAENEHIHIKIECVCSDAHFDRYVISREWLDEEYRKKWKMAEKFSFVYRYNEQNVRRPMYGSMGWDLDWPEELGEKPDNIDYYTLIVRENTEIFSTMITYSPRPREQFDKSVAPDTDNLSIMLEKEKVPDLVYLGNQNGFENISVSPFHIWADCNPTTTQNPVYDVFIQYKDGTESGYTKEEFEADEEGTSKLPWVYDGNRGNVFSIEILPPYLELDKISSITINGTKFPLSWRPQGTGR